MSPALTATSLLLVSSACFGLVPLFGRVLLELGLSTEAVALYRFCLALPLALAWLPRRRSALRPAIALAGAGLAGGLGWTTYLEAIQEVPVASAGVIYMSYPVFVVLLARLLVGHRLTARALAGAALVLAGAVIVNPPAAVSAGDLAVLLSSLPAPVGFALVIVLVATVGRDLGTRERWSVLSTGTIAGLLPAALANDPAALLPDATIGWAWITGLALVTALVPQLLYVYAARRVSPARAAATGAAELLTMLAIGALAFGEAVGAREIAGAILIIAAIGVTPAVTPRGDAAAGRTSAATSAES